MCNILSLPVYVSGYLFCSSVSVPLVLLRQRVKNKSLLNQISLRSVTPIAGCSTLLPHSWDTFPWAETVTPSFAEDNADALWAEGVKWCDWGTANFILVLPRGLWVCGVLEIGIYGEVTEVNRITHTYKAFLSLSVCLQKQICNLEDMKQVFWASVTFTAIRKSKLGNYVKSHDVKTFSISFHTKNIGL